MGSTFTLCCASDGNPVGTCGCFDWCRGQFWWGVPICIWRFIRFLVWVIWQVIRLLFTILEIIFTIVGALYPMIFWFVVALLVAWLWWFLYPELAPYIRDIAIPFINLFLELFVVAWNIGMLLWNMAVQVWNAAVPIIGMLIYIFVELVVTVLNNVVQLLGEIDVYALFKPVMEILQSVVKIAVEIVQALVSVAVPLLEAMAKIIGAIISVVFKVVEALWPMVQWFLETLFFLLEPILQIVVDMVQWFINLFAAQAMMGRSLFSLEDLAGSGGSGVRGPFDEFHYQTYGSAYTLASKYWSRSTFRRAKQAEMAAINRIVSRHPARSFDYYWTVHRPYLSRVTYPGVQVFTGIYENAYGDGPSGGARNLLGLARERNLLSLDEMRELEEPPVSHKAYWDRYDESPDDHIEWYTQQHLKKEERKKEIVESVQRRLLELAKDDEAVRKAAAQLDDEAPVINGLGIEEDEELRNRKHAFDGDLHKKLRCKGLACGGEGKILDHPVHPMREMSWKRKEAPYLGSKFKDPGQTEKEYHDSRFLVVTAWSQASLEAVDNVGWYVQHPLLRKHARDFWNRTTGHGDFHSWYEHVHARYGNFYEFLHNQFWDFADWGINGRLKLEDPEIDDRPAYSDWYKAVKVHRRRSKVLGGVRGAERQMLWVELPSEEDLDAHHRHLLSIDADPATIAEARKHARWIEQTRELIRRATSDEERNRHESPARRKLFGFEDHYEEDEEARGGTPPSWTRRNLMGSFVDGGLPFAPNPIPNADQINNESQRRDAVLQGQKTKPDATLPLFQLLAETDCYTTTPRNPLCLFQMPASWHINKAPQIVWPANATSDLDCSYLYCQPKRDLLDWRSWISWCWIWNGIQSIRIIVSAVSAPFTTAVGILNTKYGKWLGWLLEPLLAFPPGVEPQGVDWVCFAIFAPYSLLLLVAIGWVLYVVVWRIFQWIAEVITSWTALSEVFLIADEMRWEKMRRTEWFFSRTKNDPTTNLPHSRRGAPAPRFRPATGAEHVPTGDPAQAMGDASSGSGGAVGNFPPVQSSGAAVFHTASPYTEDPRRTVSVMPDDEDERSQQALLALEEALREAATELGMPSRISGRQGSDGWWDRLLDWIGLAGGSRVSLGELSAFERAFNPLLLSYQMSPYWMYQQSNYLRKQRKIEWYYSPVKGAYQRGYTRHTYDDIARITDPQRFRSKPKPADMV